MAGQAYGYENVNTVRIFGYAPGHAGEELVFYSWKDQISFTEKEIFRFQVDDNEEFFLEIEISENPLYIFSYVGVYYLYMYIEPGNEYDIVIPDKVEKSPREILNPYFEGVPTHIAVLNSDSAELNALIRDFDHMYEPLFGETLLSLTGNNGRHLFDSIQIVFDHYFSNANNPWFEIYTSYKFGLLKIFVQLQTARSLSDNYFLFESVLYNNIAYMELFNQVYNRYFLFFSRTVRGNRIFDDINRYQSYSRLRTTLQTDPVLGDGRLLELVILKGLHDAFYESDFSRSGLLIVLDSLAANTVYPEHRIISGNIRDKVTRLLTGFDPPGINLMNRTGEMVSLDDFRGYYVYLNFCTAASYSCLSEYGLLSRLRNNHGEYLKIVTVFIDESYEAMLEFLGKNNYEWDFLFYGNQPSVLKDYNIRMFPSYYLIDRDGTMLMSPAPSPSEDFELYLFRTMRSRQEIR